MPRKKTKDTTVEEGGVERDGNDDVIIPPPPRPPRDFPADAITKPTLIDGQAVTRGAITRDPLKLKIRLYIQIGELLHALETGQGDDGPVTMRERIAALTSIGRLQSLLIDKSKDDDENAGSAIRKYEGAFKNGARGRKKIARSNAGDQLIIESAGERGDESDSGDDADTYPD